MRALLSPVVCLTLITATPQVDVNQLMQQHMGGAKIEDDNSPFVPNEFIGSFRMEMHRFKNDTEEKGSPMNLHYWSVEDKTMMRSETAEQKGQDMRVLTDLKGKWTYMLMSDDKGKKTAMKSRKKNVTMTDAAEDKKQDITVTTETKVIDGHTCTKVVVKGEDGTWTGWVAKDVKAPFADMARHTAQQGRDPMLRGQQGVDGMPLEYEWRDADGKDKIVSYIRELKTGSVDPAVFSLDGYEVVEIPSFGQ